MASSSWMRSGACSCSRSVGSGCSCMAVSCRTVPELESWNHCPRCGGAIEPQDGGVRVDCPNCGFTHYASSKPTASGLVLDDDGRLLLARRAGDPEQGKWDLP